MFTTNYQVTFSETDPGGILFFAEFFKIAHITYERFLQSINAYRNYFQDDKIVIPIVHSSADFKNSVKFNDTLTCEIIVGKISESTFELLHTLKKNDKIAAKIKTVHTVLSKDGFEKAKIPEKLLSKLKENQH